MAGDLCNPCEVAIVDGDIDSADDCLRRIENVATHLPADYALYQSVGARAALSLLEGGIAEADAAYRAYVSLALLTNNRVEHASALDGLGAVAAARGDHCEAARNIGAAAAIRNTCGVTRTPLDESVVGRWEHATIDVLGPGAYRAAWRQGAMAATDDTR